MGDVLVIGDGHCKWSVITKRAIALLDDDRFEIDHVVLLGDLCDDWGIEPASMIDSLTVLSDWEHDVAARGIKVETLIGNHDLPYLLDENDRSDKAMRVRRCAPGYQHIVIAPVHRLLKSMIGLKISTMVTTNGNPWLLSHAGFTSAWAGRYLSQCIDEGTINNTKSIAGGEIASLKMACAEGLSTSVNKMYENEDWNALYSIGHARGGWRGVAPSPLWADKSELLADPVEIDVDDDQLVIPQIVGHTPVATVEEWIRSGVDASEYDVVYGASLVFCDTWSQTSGYEDIGDKSLLVLKQNGDLVKVLADESVILVEHEWNTRYERLQHERDCNR